MDGPVSRDRAPRSQGDAGRVRRQGLLSRRHQPRHGDEPSDLVRRQRHVLPASGNDPADGDAVRSDSLGAPVPRERVQSEHGREGTLRHRVLRTPQPPAVHSGRDRSGSVRGQAQTHPGLRRPHETRVPRSRSDGCRASSEAAERVHSRREHEGGQSRLPDLRELDARGCRRPERHAGRGAWRHPDSDRGCRRRAGLQPDSDQRRAYQRPETGLHSDLPTARREYDRNRRVDPAKSRADRAAPPRDGRVCRGSIHRSRTRSIGLRP